MPPEFSQGVLIAVFAIAIVAVAGWLPPKRRWGRQLRRDAALWRNLPDGDFRAELEASIHQQTKRLSEYRRVYRGALNLINWVSLLVPLALLVVFVVVPNPFRDFDSPTWILLAVDVVWGGFGFVSVVSGRNHEGMTAAQYSKYLQHQHAQGRLDRIRRKEKAAARRARKEQKLKAKSLAASESGTDSEGNNGD
jgi:hypothetical protein